MISTNALRNTSGRLQVGSVRKWEKTGNN